MATVTIQVPDDAFKALRRSPQELGREIRLAAAMLWYSQRGNPVSKEEIRCQSNFSHGEKIRCQSIFSHGEKIRCQSNFSHGEKIRCQSNVTVQSPAWPSNCGAGRPAR